MKASSYFDVLTQHIFKMKACSITAMEFNGVSHKQWQTCYTETGSIDFPAHQIKPLCQAPAQELHGRSETVFAEYNKIWLHSTMGVNNSYSIWKEAASNAKSVIALSAEGNRIYLNKKDDTFEIYF